MEYDDVIMFAESMARIQAMEQIQAYNVIRLTQAKPSDIRSTLSALERAANGNRIPVTKTTLQERIQFMRASGVKVDIQ